MDMETELLLNKSYRTVKEILARNRWVPWLRAQEGSHLMRRIDLFVLLSFIFLPWFCAP